MWVCKKCGTSNSDNSNYCSNCGQSYESHKNEEEVQKEKPTSIKTVRNILICIVSLIVLFALCAIFITKNSIYGYYMSESGIYSVSINRDGSCNWYQNGIRFDGFYERDNQHLTLSLAGNGQYRDTVFSADIEDHNLRILGGTVNSELFIKQKKPEEIKALDSQDFTATSSNTATPTVDTVFVESSSGVSIAETVLLNENNIRVTALRYEESQYSTLNYENIAFHVENNRSNKIKVSIAYIKTNGIVQRVFPDMYPNTYVEPYSECDGVIALDPEYINLSGSDHIYSLEVSLVISDDNFNDILISQFVSIPIIDNRTHEFKSTPIWLNLINDDHIEASILGYRIDDRQLYLYFNLKTDDTVSGDNRYIEFLGGREEISAGGTIKINGIDSDMYMWETYDRQPECAFVEDIYFEEPTDSIKSLEFAFVIYGVDRNVSKELRLFSSSSIKLSFASNGLISSADGTVNRYEDAINSYY